jgi:hypothetical protein
MNVGFRHTPRLVDPLYTVDVQSLRIQPRQPHSLPD